MKRAASLLAVALASGCATREPAAPVPSSPQVQVPVPELPPPVPAQPEPDPAGTTRLRCDESLELRVRMLQDEVHLDGLPGGPAVLLRDAGGVTPQQSVFSSPRVRAEFGLGPRADEVVVHVLEPRPRDLRCRPA